MRSAMGRLARTCWRRAAGFIAACLLVVLAAGPGLDSAICQADAVHPVAHGGGVTAVANPSPENTPCDGADHAGLCAHGHFHAGAPILTAVAATLQADVTTEAYLADLKGPPEAAQARGIERPPRA